MKTRTLISGLCLCLMAGCTMVDDDNMGSNYPAYQPYNYNDMQYQNYNVTIDYTNQTQPEYGRNAKVPDSYHVGAYHSPTPAKDVDRQWVNSQNPQGYTIEIADSEKASHVAKQLYKAPKKDRMAEIKYNRNGKAHYKGLYGSYNSKEEAQEALNSLPDDIKQGAGVKNWGNVQTNVSE
ncbi:SPOR domain-containing protein [Legionella dresdenensis]|uniref:SPOR domain-containing protein n=1 Tax=Legionella dresdenensis TaxID=450200 RepID=A0ABV8CGS9_9GAMM